MTKDRCKNVKLAFKSFKIKPRRFKIIKTKRNGYIVKAWFVPKSVKRKYKKL